MRNSGNRKPPIEPGEIDGGADKRNCGHDEKSPKLSASDSKCGHLEVKNSHVCPQECHQVLADQMAGERRASEA